MITKPCDMCRETEQAAEKAKRPKEEMNQHCTHLDVRKHGSHHGRCPANSTMVDAAKVENKQVTKLDKH